MKIVFIGEVDFSYHCLESVIKNNGNVVGIVTSTESKINSDFKDLTPIAVKNKIPIHYTKDINGFDTISWVKSLEPDIIFCWGISRLLKSEILSLTKMGTVGVHPALLPYNRGRHPLIWALVLGLKESGLTFFFMNEGVDSGPILSQKKFIIKESDDAGNLYEKIKSMADAQIAEFLPKLESKEYECYEQDNTLANYWRKRTRIDGLIDWRMSAQAILNLVRALTKPYPGAEFIYKGQSITVWKAEKCEMPATSNMEPGKVLGKYNGMPLIKCYDSAVAICEYNPRIEFNEGDYLL